jgi:hypothetical protein
MDAAATPLPVGEPALHQYVYLVRHASGDTPARAQARYETFLAQVRAAVAHLCALVNQPPPPVHLAVPERVGRHEQVQVYPPPDEGPFCLTVGPRHFWLWAYAVHDSYLIRIIYAMAGTHPVETLVQMAAEWRWEPAPSTGLLGQTSYHAGIVLPKHGERFGRTVLAACARSAAEDDGSALDLSSADTPVGPLYLSSTRPDAYALAYPDASAEGRANRLLDVTVPELTWQEHKVRAQGRLYEEEHYPALSAAEAAVTEAIETVLRQDTTHGSPGPRLSHLQGQLHALSDAYVRLSRLIGEAQMAAQTMEIGLANYRAALPRLFTDTQQHERVAEARLRLSLRDRAQIEADLVYLRLTLARAETVLDTIQTRVDLLRGEIDRRIGLTLSLVGTGLGLVQLFGLDERLIPPIAMAVGGTLVLYGLWWLWQKWRYGRTRQGRR